MPPSLEGMLAILMIYLLFSCIYESPRFPLREIHRFCDCHHKMGGLRIFHNDTVQELISW